MLRVLAVVVSALALSGPAAIAGTWLAGPPAPAPVKRALAVELRASTAQVRSLVGSVIPGRAIVGASLDAKHFVWAAPTDRGGYCMGMTDPHAVVDGDSCTSASGGSWGSYYDCDGSVVMGGRMDGLTRARARALEIRHDGTTLRLAIDPGHGGFFIARLRAAFFRDVMPRDRSTWPHYAIVDARGRVIAPARLNAGRLGPPDHVIC